MEWWKVWVQAWYCSCCIMLFHCSVAWMKDRIMVSYNDYWDSNVYTCIASEDEIIRLRMYFLNIYQSCLDDRMFLQVSILPRFRLWVHEMWNSEFDGISFLEWLCVCRILTVVSRSILLSYLCWYFFIWDSFTYLHISLHFFILFLESESERFFPRCKNKSNGVVWWLLGLQCLYMYN